MTTDAGPSIRRIAPEEWRTYRDLRLRALADAPEAFGATLANEQRRSEAEWIARLAATPSIDFPVLAEVNRVPAGLAWGRIEEPPDVAHVYQMWVDPAHRNIGLGKALLDAIVHWAKSMHVRELVLGVTAGNSPALRLYLRAGFVPVGGPRLLWQGSDAIAQEMRLRL